jgi:hypothetical protein
MQLTLVWALAVATLAVYRGAREVSAAARLTATAAPDAPALRHTGGDPGLRRGLAALGLAVTPQGQRTRLVCKLSAAGPVGRFGTAEWHDFLARRGALALGALGCATFVAIFAPALALPTLAADGWIVWRGQEARLADEGG